MGNPFSDPIDEVDTEAVAEYAATLEGDDEDSGRGAAKELGQLGRAGGRVLVAAASDPRARVRANVAYGIRWMENPGEEERVTLLGLLDDPDFDVRAEACLPLARLGRELGRPAIGRLVKVLEDGVEAGHKGAVYTAIYVLTRLGSAAGEAAPALVAFIQRARREPSAWTSRSAVDALGWVRSCDESDVEVLQEEFAAHPALAAQSLGAYGSLARGAASRLRPLLDHADRAVRCAAASALARIDLDERAVEVLVDLAVTGDNHARLDALAGLGDVHLLPDHLRARLRARLDDPETGLAALAMNFDSEFTSSDPEAKLASAYFLRGYGPLAEVLAPKLRVMLDDPDPWLRIGMASALARIDPGDDAIAALERLMGDARPEVRRGAALALDEFASLPDRTLGRLRALQDDPDPGVAKAATFVLGEILARGPAPR